jgi:ureidoglycolate lyase
VNYHRSVWHHPLIAVERESEFIVIERAEPGDNLEQAALPRPLEITRYPGDA